MRTTVELPAELLREAKARAAKRGESLKSLLARAVASELGRSPDEPSGQKRRSELPTFGNPGGPQVNLTNKDLARSLANEDAVLMQTRARRKR